MTSICDPCQCTTTNTKGRNPAIDAYRHDPIGLELGQCFAVQGSRFSHSQVIGLLGAWSISSIVLAWGLRRRKDDQGHLQEEPLIPSLSLAPSASFRLSMGRPSSWPGPVCRTFPGNTLASCPPHLERFFLILGDTLVCGGTALISRCCSYRLSRVTVWYGIPLHLSPGELFHGISIAWLIFESSQLNWLAALYCAPIHLKEIRTPDLKPSPEAPQTG